MSDTDKWEVLVVASDNETSLCCAPAYRVDEYTAYYKCQDFLIVVPTPYTENGDIGTMWVYKNDKKYAKIPVSVGLVAVAGALLQGNLLVKREYLIVATVDPVCTCGGWVTYGKDADLHADDLNNTCDLRKK